MARLLKWCTSLTELLVWPWAFRPLAWRPGAVFPSSSEQEGAPPPAAAAPGVFTGGQGAHRSAALPDGAIPAAWPHLQWSCPAQRTAGNFRQTFQPSYFSERAIFKCPSADLLWYPSPPSISIYFLPRLYVCWGSGFTMRTYFPLTSSCYFSFSPFSSC